MNLQALSACALFEGMDPARAADLVRRAGGSGRGMRRGEVLAREGEPCAALGIVLSGTVEVRHETAEGGVQTIARLEAGNTFAEAVLFARGAAYPATVVCGEGGEVLMLQRARVVELCRSDDTVLENFVRLLSERIMLLNRGIRARSHRTLRGRIAALLLEQAQGKPAFVLPMTRADMARQLLAARPSLSRELSRMKADGLIDFYRSSVKILNDKGLRACLNAEG